jgi:hypothetical protein
MRGEWERKREKGEEKDRERGWGKGERRGME